MAELLKCSPHVISASPEHRCLEFSLSYRFQTVIGALFGSGAMEEPLQASLHFSLSNQKVRKTENSVNEGR